MSGNIKNIIFDVVENCETAQLATFNFDLFPETRTVRNLRNFRENPQYEEKLKPTWDLYFLTNVNTPKYGQLKKNNRVCAYFFDPNTRKAIRLFGTVTILEDSATKDYFWNSGWEKFGYMSSNDKNLCILKLLPEFYKYYDSDGKLHYEKINIEV